MLQLSRAKPGNPASVHITRLLEGQPSYTNGGFDNVTAVFTHGDTGSFKYNAGEWVAHGPVSRQCRAVGLRSSGRYVTMGLRVLINISENCVTLKM